DWLAAEDVNGLAALDTFHQTYPDKPGPLPEAPPPGPPPEPTGALMASRDFGNRRGIVSRRTPPRPAPAPQPAPRRQQQGPGARASLRTSLVGSMAGVAEEGSPGEGQR